MSNNLALIEQDIRALQPVFESVAVDRGMSFDREVEFAMQILSSSEFVMAIAIESPQSLRDAITNVAAIGISLNPAKKQAYLVPRKKRICLDISYMGLIDMAAASGSIRWAQAGIVHKNDKFRLNGYDRAPTHEFDPFDMLRGEVVGSYSVAKTADGDFLTHTMTIGDIYNIRNRSESFKSGRNSPWKSDEGEMIKKTVLKQASKTWPKTERLDKAIHYLNTDGGEGLEQMADDAPVVQGKPAVTMPKAKPPVQDVTDVEARSPRQDDVQAKGQGPDRAPDAKPANRSALESAPNNGQKLMATAGEIAYITGRIGRNKMSITAARELAGLDPSDMLQGLTKDEFVALRDVTK
jgi:recombination protein RecT